MGLRDRRPVDTSEQATDAGYPGRRAPPPRLPLSLQGFIASGASLQIGEGTLAVVLNTQPATAPGVQPSVITVKLGQTSRTLLLGPSGFAVLRAADGFVSVTVDSRSSAFLAVDTGHTNSVIALGGGAASAVGLAGDNTQVDTQQIAPLSVAAATVETVGQAGAVAIVIGNRVTFEIECGPAALGTAADVLSYVALKGHTSGVYFAVAARGQAVEGEFDFTNATSEKLDLVYRNQDTVAEIVSGWWESTTP